MTTTRTRWFNALFHRGPGYEPPTRSEVDLRTTFTALADRWAIQLADYNAEADQIGTGQGRRDARLRGTQLLRCISDLNIVLDCGRLPHDLADDEETAFAPPPHLPRRDDAIARWLQQQRDAAADYPQAYSAADDLLDLYRLHADTGTPLGEHVCEGRVVGDCECFETGGTR